MALPGNQYLKNIPVSKRWRGWFLLCVAKWLEPLQVGKVLAVGEDIVPWIGAECEAEDARILDVILD